MPIGKTIEAPEWVDSGATITGGLDLLGLRLPVQIIGGTLLDGITTVTPQVRYIAFRAWLIHCYGQTGLPDSWQRFTEFALRIESALVIGNLIQNRGISGLIGADEAVVRLDANTASIAVTPLVKSPAATIYAGPSDQLGITKMRDDAVPALVIERGNPLALLVERRFSSVPLIRRLIEDAALSEISQDDLQEVGAIARIDQIPDDEREALLASIIPPAPRSKERARIGTYTALLTLARTLKTRPDEQDLFVAASSKDRFGEPILDHAADGWTTYCVRDALAVTQESVLSAVMTEITKSPNSGLSGVEHAAVIASLMERVEEHSIALRELELLGPAESVTDLSFRQLWSRMEQRIAPGLERQRGISRWASPLNESTVYGVALRAGAGSLSLAVVAWIFSGLRVGSAVREGGHDSGNMSYQGWRRMGLRDVVLPELERFHREDRPVRDVAAELAYRTVHQHLQIAWSRLQADLRRDVALLTTEGNKWCARGKGFGGGRTASRLQQALSWLDQLRLIDASGITADGEVVRQAGLRVLATGGEGMNPRLFCRERTFHKALLLTYSFDPIFFEQVVLPDLWAGRSGDILAIGDRDQLEQATRVSARQVRHLGKNYLLAGANHEGAFHPKVMLRLGAKDGAVLVGSGNLTSSGWGGNQELGTAWMLGPGHVDDGAWLHAFFADVRTWCCSDLERDAVSRMRDVPWLSLTPPTTATTPLLHSRSETTLSTLLSQRWAGRRFDTVRILTGSTDQSGAFLRWAHATFGIKSAIVALTPSMASFDSAKLSDLPIELTLIAAPPDQPLHAKFYWFEGELGAAAVMGSANCSAAAWLLAPAKGGNVETVVVYDTASADTYKDLLAIFERSAQTPREFLTPKAIEPMASPLASPHYRLLGLRWDKESQQVLAVIDPRPTADMTVELMMGTQTLAMNPQSQMAGHWVCAAPDGLGSGTSFAAVRVATGTSSWATAPRWIDDLAALRDASQSARLLEPFKGLERSVTSAEQRQMLEDLQDVAHALFNDTAAFRDPGTATFREDKNDNETNAAPVDPNDLVCHLEEGSDSVPHLGGAGSGMLSISGILRMLFDAEGDAPGATVAAEDEQLDEGMSPPDNSARGGKAKNPDEPPSFEAPSVEARFRERLVTLITTFLTQLRSTAFAEHCSATQMVQAISFPLAVALRGQKRGWVGPDLAERWGLDVISILFRGASPHDDGLLHIVDRRYAQNGQSEIFGDVVGNGTLWIVVVSTLGGTRWHGPGTYLDKALALREVFTSPQLLASARPERIAGLLGKVGIEDAKRYLAAVAPAVTRLLNGIEERLRPLWSDAAKTQTELRITHRVGDLLWRDNIWAVCLEENRLENNLPTRVRLEGQEKQVAPGYYVNVTDLAGQLPGIQQRLTELQRWTEGESKEG